MIGTQIFAVFKTAPKRGDLALALFRDDSLARQFASTIVGSFIDEWQVSNAEFMAHEGFADDD